MAIAAFPVAAVVSDKLCAPFRLSGFSVRLVLRETEVGAILIESDRYNGIVIESSGVLISQDFGRW